MLATILQRHRDLALYLIVHFPGHADAPWLCELLKPGGDIYPLPIDVPVVLDDNVAEGNPYAQP